MVFLWIVLAVLLYNVGVSGQTFNASSACFSAVNCNSVMDLVCGSDNYLFVMRMQVGYKPSSSACNSGPTCSQCCHPEIGDCFSDYSDDNFGRAYTDHRCWHRHSCRSPVQQDNKGCSGHNQLSGFAVASYICLQSQDITEFHKNTTIIRPAVAIQYNRLEANYPVLEGGSQTWHCQVDTADCVQRQADVILVKENYTAGSSNRCSSVGWIGGSFLSCVPLFQYLNFNTSTPFNVSVNVNEQMRQPSGWAVVRSQDGTPLTVTCGFPNDNPPNICSSVAPPTTTTHDSLGGSTGPAGSVNTGAVAGGVVVVVVVLVAVAVAVYFVRRHGGCRGTLQYLRGKPSSSHPAASRDQNVDVNYLHVIPDPAHASHHASPAPTYENAASRQNASDSEYVNAASEQSRPASQLEYSSLEWSRDPARTYAELKKA